MTANTETLVCNTGPLIAIAAGTGSWAVLQQLSQRMLIPVAVQRELEAGGPSMPGCGLLEQSPWIHLADQTPLIPAYLNAALDPGEAAVIATALDMGVGTVAIDERNARHVARSCGLKLTGSLGLLIQALHAGASIDLEDVINRMRIAGVWISESLASEALRLAYPA
jgi:predicted nucleic acid-binding protein